MSPIGGQTSHAGVCDGQQLHALLREQAEVVGLLVRAAMEKRSAILDRDSAKIEAAVADEAQLAERVAALEERRSAWIADWASARRVDGENDGPTLSDVLSRLPREQAAPIKETADALIESVDELHQINRQNADLIYHSLAHVQALLGALAGDGEGSGLYGPRAEKGDSQSRALVDWRV